MNIIITLPTTNDIKGIQEVFHKTWLATYPNKEAGISVDDIEDKFVDAYTEETLQKRNGAMLNPPENVQILIAKDDEKVVGICRSVKRQDVNQLQAIYILPDYQGQGIGKMFWNKALKFFGDNKDTIVQVATYNKNAIAFYEKLGFVDNGKRFTEERHRMKSGSLIPEMEMVIVHKS